MDVADYTPANEDYANSALVLVLDVVDNGDVVEFEIEVLVHVTECTEDCDVVFELDGGFLVGDCFKEGEEEHLVFVRKDDARRVNPCGGGGRCDGLYAETRVL